MGGSESHESNDPFFNFLSPRRLSRGTFLPSLIMELLQYLPAPWLRSLPSRLRTRRRSRFRPPAFVVIERVAGSFTH